MSLSDAATGTSSPVVATPRRPPVPSTRAGAYTFAIAAELARALRVRQVTQRALAKACGVAPRTVWHWTTGQSLPTLENAARMAEALDWPLLQQLVRSGRVAPCRNCGRRVISNASNAGRFYCDEACRRVWVKRGGRGHVLTRTDTKLRVLIEAVDAMCQSCEPNGLCGDGSCPLRPVSPLPLQAGLVVVERAEDGRKSRWDDPAARERAAAAQAAVWSKSAERRQRISEWNRQKWATMTPEQRAERGRAVSEALRRRAA